MGEVPRAPAGAFNPKDERTATMKKFICTLAIAAVVAVSAFADGNVRTTARIPDAAHGTNAVVAVRFGGPAARFAVQPLAFDIIGDTVSSGNVTAYQIRNFGGVATTNVLKAAAACAATNACSVADFRAYCYGNEPVYFQFTLATGGTLVLYGQTKE